MSQTAPTTLSFYGCILRMMQSKNHFHEKLKIKLQKQQLMCVQLQSHILQTKFFVLCVWIAHQPNFVFTNERVLPKTITNRVAGRRFKLITWHGDKQHPPHTSVTHSSLYNPEFTFILQNNTEAYFIEEQYLLTLYYLNW